MSVEEIETAHGDVDAAFEHLVRSAGISVERTSLLRSLREAIMATPGPTATNWTRWILDAGRATGLYVDSFKAHADSAFNLADSGVTLLTWDESTNRFLVIERKRGTNVWDQVVGTSDNPTRSSGKRIANLLTKGNRTRLLNWVVVGRKALTQDDLGSHGHDDEHHTTHMSPLARCWKLLRPEFGEIGILLVLGVVVGILATAVPIAGQQLVRTVTFGTLYQPIIVLSLMLLLFLSFMGALQAMSVFVVELIQQRLFARTVVELSLLLPRTDYATLRHANGPELINRFLDIATVQKVVAGLLVDGLSLVLTTIIGMSLLAFYHPFLLGYDLLLLLQLIFVILVLGRGGTRTAIDESFEKYRIAGWLEDIARCPLAFRLSGGSDFAVARADRLTADYLAARHSHFLVLLRQILSLFAIQAVASTALLGLGGYLVMHEQLTLGQLVAAELIVTMIVGAFAKLAKHLEGFFDLMAAMDKLGHVFDLPPERSGKTLRVQFDSHLAEVHGVPMMHMTGMRHEEGQGNSTESQAVLRIEQGAHTAVYGGAGAGKSYLADLLFGIGSHEQGNALIGGCDVRELSTDVLRRHVALCRSIEVLSASIEDNVHMGRLDVDAGRVREALSIAGLYEAVTSLPDGVKTKLSCDGAPLNDSRLVRLMIARAIAGNPRLLVIDGLLDSLPDDLTAPLISALQREGVPWTLLVLTGRADLAKQFRRSFKFTTDSVDPSVN